MVVQSLFDTFPWHLAFVLFDKECWSAVGFEQPIGLVRHLVSLGQRLFLAVHQIHSNCPKEESNIQRSLALAGIQVEILVGRSTSKHLLGWERSQGKVKL